MGEYLTKSRLRRARRTVSFDGGQAGTLAQLSARALRQLSIGTRPAIALIGATVAALAGVPSNAQTVSSTPVVQSQATGCRVERSSVVKLSGAAPLVAICDTQGALLGSADSYTATANDQLGAVLVEIHNQGTRRFVLVSKQSAGAPLVEDLNGEIAMKAGREPTSPIDDVTIDITNFAVGGTINVQAPAAASPVATVQLGQQVQAARAAATSQ